MHASIHEPCIPVVIEYVVFRLSQRLFGQLVPKFDNIPLNRYTIVIRQHAYDSLVGNLDADILDKRQRLVVHRPHLPIGERAPEG